MSRAPALPVAMPGGDLLPHMSARRRRQAIDNIYAMVGGEERTVHEIDRDKTGAAYWRFFDAWARGAGRPLSVEHTMNTDSVEALWEKIDAREQDKAGQVIEFTAREVSATDAEVEAVDSVEAGE